MDFDACTVNTQDIRVGFNKFHFLHFIKDFLDCAVFRPPAELHVNRVPVPVLFRHYPPFAAIFYDVGQSTKELVIRYGSWFPCDRHKMFDFCKLFFVSSIGLFYHTAFLL